MLTIYSANNRHRVTLAETAVGVEFRLWKYLGEVERRGVNVSRLDPAEVAGSWKQTERGLIDVPFHVAADHLYRVVRGLV